MLVTCTIQMCWIYISCIWQRNMLFSYSARSTTFQSRINLWDQKEYQLRAGVLNIICPTSNTWAVECITLFYISLSTEKCGISVIQAELCVLCVVSTSLGCWPCTPLSCVGLRVCQRKAVVFWISLQLVWAWRITVMHSPQFGWTTYAVAVCVTVLWPQENRCYISYSIV